MRQTQLFGVGIQSKSTNVTAQTRVNMYLEITPQADKSQIVAYGTPGLELFIDLVETSPVRGMYAAGVYIYVVIADKLHRVNVIGTKEELGTLLTGTNGARVGMADNGFQMLIVDGDNGYIYTYATGVFAVITDTDFIYLVKETAIFQDGYFIINEADTGKFWISASYNGLAWDALDYATAESNPDKLVYPYADHGELILFGEVATEFWTNTGALDFPYQRIGGAAIEWGLAARWSVAKFDNSVIWLAKNRLGEVQVTRLNGYTPQRVSTFDLERIINAYEPTSIIAASGYSYIHNGHPFYVINFTEGSWLYDGASDAWSQLKSYGIERHRGHQAVSFQGRTIIADFENSKLYEPKGDVYTDDGDPIVSELTSTHLFNSLEKTSINEFQVDMETGSALSTGQGSDPQITLKTSRDGGHTWGNERFSTMGKIGDYKARARWLRLGQARDWVFKITISDPVKRAIIGAWFR